MMKEVTEENIKKLLEKIPDNTSSVERLILYNEGTVQTLLSVLFKVPIRVEIMSQIEHDHYIIRWTKLIAYHSLANQVVVCVAESVIDKEKAYNGFLTGIREKKSGIGQLISSIEVETKRDILGFYSDSSIMSRTYTINSIPYIRESEEDKTIFVTITEVFPKEVFKTASVII